jgi:hypothetical protein
MALQRSVAPCQAGGGKKVFFFPGGVFYYHDIPVSAPGYTDFLFV